MSVGRKTYSESVVEMYKEMYISTTIAYVIPTHSPQSTKGANENNNVITMDDATIVN